MQDKLITVYVVNQYSNLRKISEGATLPSWDTASQLVCPGFCVCQDIHSCSIWGNQRPQARGMQGLILLVLYRQSFPVCAGTLKRSESTSPEHQSLKILGEGLHTLSLHHNVRKHTKGLKKAWTKENFPNVFNHGTFFNVNNL